MAVKWLIIIIIITWMARWNKATDVLDWRSRGRGFDFRSDFCCATTMGNLFIPLYTSVTKQYKLVPV